MRASRRQSGPSNRATHLLLVSYRLRFGLGLGRRLGVAWRISALAASKEATRKRCNGNTVVTRRRANNKDGARHYIGGLVYCNWLLRARLTSRWQASAVVVVERARQQRCCCARLPSKGIESARAREQLRQPTLIRRSAANANLYLPAIALESVWPLPLLLLLLFAVAPKRRASRRPASGSWLLASGFWQRSRRWH